MRNILLLAVILIICAGAAYGQSLNSVITSDLTSVISELSGNTFTWTLINNTGSTNDGNPGWDVLIWELEPIGLPSPSQVIAPSGWEWVPNGHSKFQVKDKNKKYESTAAIAPGNSLVFTYKIDSSRLSGVNLSNVRFITHVAAVEPTPTSIGGGNLKWTPVTINGSPTWHDNPSTTPEPGAILPFLLVCSAAASIAKSVRRKR
jgi:hypothetical protein